jgi:hypothetical protein
MSLNASADIFSFLYIQGDKQTPFYVKLEDAMQPRYGKNYCILPQLAPGPMNIEILFQQNTYPPQKFTILIPEGGSRSFLLVRKDSAYSLYDLQQGFYLEGGNKAEDDRLPSANQPNTTIARAADNQLPTEPVAAKQVAIEAEKPAVTKAKPAEKEPVFIGDIELGKGTTEATKDPSSSSTGVPDVHNSATNVGITNSDCPTPLSSADFGKIFNEMSGMGTDEERVEYINGKMNLCYASWQVRTLAGKLSGDAARFSLLKRIYPRVTDQAAFPLLDDLLTTDIWKAEFARIVHP